MSWWQRSDSWQRWWHGWQPSQWLQQSWASETGQFLGWRPSKRKPGGEGVRWRSVWSNPSYDGRQEKWSRTGEVAPTSRFLDKIREAHENETPVPDALIFTKWPLYVRDYATDPAIIQKYKEAEAVDEDKKEDLVAVPAAAPQGETPEDDYNYDKNNPLGVDCEFDDNEPMYKDTGAGLVAAPRKDDPLDEERGEDDSQVRQVEEEAKSWVLGIDDLVSCVPAELQPVVTLLRKEAQHLKTKIAPLLNRVVQGNFRGTLSEEDHVRFYSCCFKRTFQVEAWLYNLVQCYYLCARCSFVGHMECGF